MLTLSSHQVKEATDALVAGGAEACAGVLQKYFPGCPTDILKETINYIKLVRIMEKR